MAKRAFLIGCNYPGTKAELHGCVNDVTRMYKCLVDRFGFDESDITVMVDTDKRSVQPTGANIKKVLGRLIDESEPGDVLFLHYSGHGTQVPAESGDADDDGLDEAIVPTDLNLLTDDDFRLLFNKIKRGVSFTFISDSCHSGGLIDHEKEQIGSSTDDTRGFEAPVPSESRAGSRGYDAGYGRESAPYGRREEPDYEREERHSRRGEYDEEEPRREQYGHGRTDDYEEEPRRQRYGHGRRDEYEEEEPRQERYGSEEYGQEPSREGRYGQRPGRREEGDDYGGRVNSVNKSLSIETLTQMLSDQSGHEVKPGNIRTSLYDMFGEDASPTVKVFVNLIASRLGGDKTGAEGGGGGVWGSLGGLAMDFLKAKLNDSDSGTSLPAPVVSSAVSQSGHAGRKPPASERVADDVGILISGCQSNETSADANPTGDPAQAYGALSNGIQSILAEKEGAISNGDLVRKVRAMLKKQGFSQHPCLYSSDENVNAPFIC